MNHSNDFHSVVMRAVLQRVSDASVSVGGEIVGQISHGFLVLLGVEAADEESDIDWLVKKISQMRVFEDEDGKMNTSLAQLNGDALVVSQFTLHASTKKGNRPSFIKAARPEKAEALYDEFCKAMTVALSGNVETGAFGANMQVALVNDGPVTILIDSRNRE